jgi:hypothetical protein
MLSLNLKLFNIYEYLNIYYYFIKKNIIIKIYYSIKKIFTNKLEIKFLNYKFYSLNNSFIFFDYNKLLKFNENKLYFYNKYNYSKDLKILFLNRMLKKFNKYLSIFKIYRNKKKLK